MTSVPKTIRAGGIDYDLRSSRPPLWVGKHDWEINFSRHGVPEVHFLDHYTDLTEPWQRFFYGLNNPPQFSEADWKRLWAKYTSSDIWITDYHGSDVAADYINGTLLDRGPMRIKFLYTGGNVMTGREDPDWFYPVGLNAFAAPPFGMTYQTHPWFIHQATNITSSLERIVNPFPFFGGRNTGIPVFNPFMCNPNKLARVPRSWVRKMAPDEPIPNPYSPPMTLAV